MSIQIQALNLGLPKLEALMSEHRRLFFDCFRQIGDDYSVCIDVDCLVANDQLFERFVVRISSSNDVNVNILDV